jgi:hypothetical protein
MLTVPALPRWRLWGLRREVLNGAKGKPSTTLPRAPLRLGGRRRQWVPPGSMLLRKEDVEMRGDTGFSSPFRSLPRFDRMLDQLRHLIRAGMGKIGRSASPRPGLLLEDVADLSARAMVYMLAMLGLLHVLGLGAVGP